jgi:large subunit ribosomal protein L29
MARNVVDLTDLGDTDLLDRLNETKEELFNLRFQMATGQLENHARLKQVKKEVARVLTELRMREIEAAEDQQVQAAKAESENA